MNINWKVRLKSGTFWAGLVSLTLTLIYTILNMAGIIPAFSQKEIMDVVVMILQIPAFIGVISDPTTKGLSDSERALTYERPRNDSE